MNIEAIRNWGKDSAERARNVVLQVPTYVAELRGVLVAQVKKTGSEVLEPVTFIRQAHQDFLREEPIRARWVITGATIGLLTPPTVCLLGFLFRNEAVAFGGFVLTLAELGSSALTYQKLLLDKP